MSQKVQNATAEPAKAVIPMFGTPIFSYPENVSVRKGQRAGMGDYCAALNVSVPIADTGLRVDATIWATKSDTPNGYDIAFNASLPRRGNVSVEPGELSKYYRERFLAHVEREAFAWRGWNVAEKAVLAAFDGRTAKPEAGEIQRPRLVKTVKPSEVVTTV